MASELLAEQARRAHLVLYVRESLTALMLQVQDLQRELPHCFLEAVRENEHALAEAKEDAAALTDYEEEARSQSATPKAAARAPSCMVRPAPQSTHVAASTPPQPSSTLPDTHSSAIARLIAGGSHVSMHVIRGDMRHVLHVCRHARFREERTPPRAPQGAHGSVP